MPEYSLKINVKAELDLVDIYTIGFTQWGEAQADIYYDRLLERFDKLLDNPYLCQGVDHIRVDYRRCVCGVHSIYYRINDSTVEGMRVLRSQDTCSI